MASNMSARIKEFAEQAKLYAASSLPSNWDEGDYIISPKELERFAELIIQECATIANRAENDESWIAPVGDLIKEHFGIDK